MGINKYYWLALIPVVAFVIGFTILPDEISTNGKKVTVYKSPTCGCCVNYISILKQAGYEVETVKTENMAAIKDKYGISEDMESCHTSVFEDYVVEGHVPLSVVDKLLTEKPDIRGIALPDMPAGSPGMAGFKREPFKIYALSDNDTSIYIEE
ncbi:MAG: DUF411 domain-containing protein [Candidatus Komeilibacteria bacterium]